MSVQLSQSLRNTDGGLHRLRSIAFPPHLAISGIVAEIRDEPLGPRSGAKRPARITSVLGGCGRNGGIVAVTNGVACGILGPQADGHWSDLCRDLAKAEGLEPYVVGRKGVAAALAVAYPNGSPGTFDLDVQRMAPLTVKEFMAVVATAATKPQSVIVGPRQLDAEELKFHKAVSKLARHRALMLHPSVLHHSAVLRKIASFYDFVQMNKAEASVLDPRNRNIELLACRTRYVLGESVNFAITNGSQCGLAWVDRDWHVIQPTKVRQVVCDIGAGDAWGAAFVLALWYGQKQTKEAIAYANQVAAAWISGGCVPRF